MSRPGDDVPRGEDVPGDGAPRDVPGDDAPRDVPGGRDARDGDAPVTEEDVERMLRALDAGVPTTEAGDDVPGGGGTDARTVEHADGAAETAGVPAKLALVLTPVASAPALAGLCAMAGIDVDVVPSSSGAVAALEVAAKAPADDWDISQLLGGEDGGFPPEAEELAKNLSRLSRAGVVLLTADLATDVGIESGLSGQLSARRYTGGEPEGDVPAGLILAGADQVVEDLILGRVRADAVKGHQRSGTLPRWKAARMFGRGLRRRKP
ncbi:hypothetical protein [Georgenia subflava]|uniref:Uncharacterized protein n=1 Tax=Georgenia subflava TaxID=1622177 RepID=A0A6N7ELI8_9MICO|nr:hypothetical protein [Georgenia subflava]MPV37707.1 hypothetical protein [Georgenia subflava]